MTQAVSIPASIAAPPRAWYEALLDRGLIPDSVLRAAIRRRLRARLRREERGTIDERNNRMRAIIESLSRGPLAIHTDAANEQHYELPPEFFQLCLGPRLKYSSAYWPEGVETLAQAEDAMLELTCRRADIHDGMDILELGCGWGSLSLWMAEKFPRARIWAISNSRLQRDFIEREAARRGVRPPTVITADIVDFRIDRRFDRVVSVEMFEHIRNHRELFRRLAGWLNPAGLLFVHIFSHTRVAYPFESDDWIGRYFFTGGLMPSDDYFLHFQDDLSVKDHWRLSGRHYARTARAWLNNLDARRDRAMEILHPAFATQSAAWLNRWRAFFIACEELWGLDSGNEWIVSHYAFARRS